MRVALVALLLAGGVSGCAINSATGTGMYVSKDLASNCVKDCERLGMKLSAVVVVASMGGCVCEPPDATHGVASGGAAVAGGAAVRVAAAAAQAQQQSSQTHH